MVTADIIQWFYGLSTDTKPSNVNNGSFYTEVDTGNINCYDRENDEWYLWFSFKEE